MSEIINTSNPLLEKLRVVHGETIQLPSRGLLYEEGVLADHIRDGEVRINPMTIRDELLLRNPASLFSGETITQVVGRCVPDILKPLDLHFSDLDFILLSLRKASYGPEFEIQYDHECLEDQPSERSYLVNVDDRLRDCVYLDPQTADEEHTYYIADLDQTVKFKPLSVADMLFILQPENENLSQAEQDEHLVRAALLQVVSVDGITDPEMIIEWATNVPAGVSRDLRLHLQKLERWGITYQFGVKCKACDEDIHVNIPMNPVSFFT